MTFGEYLITVLDQFGGPTGGQENQLAGFGLSAIFFATLFLIAWKRNRREHRPREQLLVWGFGLGLVRELFMFAMISLVIARAMTPGSLESFFPPLEHTLRSIAVIFIAGAYLRFILDAPELSRRYIQVGVAGSLIVYAIMSWPWAQAVLADPTLEFHDFWADWLAHIWGAAMLAVPIVLLARKDGWLPKAVVIALVGFFLFDLLMLVNMVTDSRYETVLTPIRHNLYLWAIPVLGYVYLKELGNERDAAQAALSEERGRLLEAQQALQQYSGELERRVEERTAELTEQAKRLEAQTVELADASRQAERARAEAEAQREVAESASHTKSE